MIPVGVDIYLGTQPVDLRWGFDRLCGVITERVGRRPRSGAIFVFFGKRRHAMKVFYFDGTGLCVFYKRLDAGTFRVPLSHDGTSPTIFKLRPHAFSSVAGEAYSESGPR